MGCIPFNNSWVNEAEPHLSSFKQQPGGPALIGCICRRPAGHPVQKESRPSLRPYLVRTW